MIGDRSLSIVSAFEIDPFFYIHEFFLSNYALRNYFGDKNKNSLNHAKQWYDLAEVVGQQLLDNGGNFGFFLTLLWEIEAVASTKRENFSANTNITRTQHARRSGCVRADSLISPPSSAHRYEPFEKFDAARETILSYRVSATFLAFEIVLRWFPTRIRDIAAIGVLRNRCKRLSHL